ncbi:MAG: radical SAM protein [Coxiella sp. DG_40]|nr:MAG: radical SAM protein [Coxiella sp. DG_40]
MKVIGKVGNDDIAVVYIAKIRNEELIEFVESVQPPIPREEKWVLIISTLLGCCVGCKMCDAGGWYKGKLSSQEILQQIDYPIVRRFPDRNVNVKKFKVQFSRMGEPAFNLSVIDVLNQLPIVYNAPGLIPSLSTVAPCSCEEFFSALLDIKNKYYANGKFQLQFSIHTTDIKLRDEIIPVKKWSFAEIAEYGRYFYVNGDRKITLNFALAKDSPLEPEVLKEYFDPNLFLVKITPVNPTLSSVKNNLQSYFIEGVSDDNLNIVEKLKALGYEVIVSIGELEENKIGSNCGQYIKKFLDKKFKIGSGYQYEVDYFK